MSHSNKNQEYGSVSLPRCVVLKWEHARSTVLCRQKDHASSAIASILLVCWYPDIESHRLCTFDRLTTTRNHYTESGLICYLLQIVWCQFGCVSSHFAVLVLAILAFLRDVVGRQSKGEKIDFRIVTENKKILCSQSRLGKLLFLKVDNLNEIFPSHYLNIFQQYTQFRF